MFPKKARVKIIWRIVSTSTRGVVASGTADSSKIREKIGFGNIAKGILVGGESRDEALEQALSGALAQIIYEIENLKLPSSARPESVESPEPGAAQGSKGTVEAVKPDFLIVGMGTRHGCKVGDKLELCEVIDVKNSEGKLVFKEEKVAGEVRIQMCLDDRSKVTYSSLTAPKEGWIVRRQTASLP